jgi:hypothetical protein
MSCILRQCVTAVAVVLAFGLGGLAAETAELVVAGDGKAATVVVSPKAGGGRSEPLRISSTSSTS